MIVSSQPILESSCALKTNYCLQSTPNPTTLFVNPLLAIVQHFEFLPTPFLQIPQGNLPEFSACSCLTLFFPMLTLSPFCSILSFHCLIISCSSSSDSANSARLSAKNSSHGYPILNFFESASSTIMNSNGANADPDERQH